MVPTVPLSRDNNTSGVIPVASIQAYLKNKYGSETDEKCVQAVIELGLIPMFRYKDEMVSLISDIDDIAYVLVNSKLNESIGIGDDLFLTSASGILQIDDCTAVEFLSKNGEIDFVHYSALRNLVEYRKNKICKEDGLNNELFLKYFSDTQVVTKSKNVEEIVGRQRARMEVVRNSNASRFANTAAYMGSKRALSGFIVEGISSVLGSDGVVVDLMCGSGAAAGAFSRLWETYASDAQSFSTILATVQGGGFSVKDAQRVLAEVHRSAVLHSRMLMEKIEHYIDWEDRIFHSEVGRPLIDKYSRFLSEFPIYPIKGGEDEWEPVREVDSRRNNSLVEPYCLFTTYFANIYFGLRQSVEIDSIRYAVDQIGDERSRRWALGALISAVSRTGSTYGGHFAQPIPYVRDPSKLKVSSLNKLLEQRAQSVIHEFSVRLMDLANESEYANNPIITESGPWRTALQKFERVLGGRQVVVYLDAPYTREEYSRYYHVLETLVLYNYPSNIGVGRVPNKKEGGRFQSEFFTRNEAKLKDIFVELIERVLSNNWHVAWSYSDTGIVNVIDVVNEIQKRTGCHIKSYGAPYSHKPQGGTRTRKVTEYLILFVNADNT